ncbi:helix-turn-helix transcriptional regulator [Saccharospirillum alexandrii]|uniref:helix-turn-helix transcriptional regulator n=1 Tax=Saccharospirillum alexandrii TaxID=2448477 RepID=UPI003736262A
MRRADRLFQIIQYLQGRRLTTARQLADKLEVSERTIYRDIQDLMASGVPIDGEAGVGYVLRSGFHLPPLMFTPEEMQALIVGVRLIDAWGGEKLSAAATEALVKIETVLPPRLKASLRNPRIYALVFSDRKDLAPRLDVLGAAVNDRHKLRLHYHREDMTASERVVWPLGLVFWGSVWTLMAWCELRADFRMFRVDRIVEFEVLEAEYEETARISLQQILRQNELA